MDRRHRPDESETPHVRPEPRRGASPATYDTVHDLREGGVTGSTIVSEDDDTEAEGPESAAARQERLAASPEEAADAALAEAGPESARREALGASPELQAEEADRLLDRAARGQRPAGTDGE
jgi:hypothetical protein